MVKFIAEKADYNISAAVRGRMISLLESSAAKQNIIFIVPDQFEYETEKAVYRILDEKGLLQRFYEIRITTFSRLCREILEECGEHRPFADDIVKNIIMHKAVSENKIALAALKKIAARPGFCEKMVRTVSALKTSGVTARDLELSLNAITELGKNDKDKKLSPDMPVVKKLNETRLLYTNYEALLSGYVDKLDITALAAEHIAKGRCKVFDGANVFVDCFNDFTHSQIEFLKQVIIRAGEAGNVTFGFTAPFPSSMDVFKTANSHIVRLRDAAEENGISVEFITEELESRYAEDNPLGEVARHLFMTMKNCPPLGESCELVSAAGVYEELDYAAAKIRELTTDKGLRYGEIAVLCTDVGAYGKHVESAFNKYDIPIFLDTPEPILYRPLINLVISILNALENFNIDTVMSCVKSKFFAKPKTKLDDKNDDDEDKKIVLSDKDVDEFENYIYEWDLKTSHLKKPFEFKDKDGKNDLSLQTAEQVRQSVVVPILELRKKLKKSGAAIDGAEITELLYDFLVNKVGMKRAFFKRCKNEENDSLDQDRVDLYQRLWNALIDIFDKLHAELAGTNLTIGEYGEIFREICASTSLANPPQFIDCVLVGDIDRTRADNIKAAFIVGASYEAFPTPAFEAGIFSQYEIELIFDKIVHFDNDLPTAEALKQLEKIAETGRREYCLTSVQDRYYLSLYRAYRAATLPTEYLCISCPEVDAAGEFTARSDVFGEFTSTFKNTKIISADSRGNDFYCRTPQAAKMRYAMGLNNPSEEHDVLRSVLLREDKEFVDALDEIHEMRSDIPVGKPSADGKFSGKHALKPETARLLFSNAVSATAVEKLNLCKFNYFCEYGLKIEERSKRSFTKSKRGDAIHFVFEHIFKEYCGDMDAFFALRRGELLSLSKKYLTIYRENETNNDNTEDKRTEYLFNNIANAATDVLITMQTELFARKYRPKFFELRLKGDPDNDPHYIIDNESAPTIAPPDAEIFSAEEDVKNFPNSSKTQPPKNAPYLITKPLSIRLDNGMEITVQGIVDRVDMFGIDEREDGKPVAYIRVVDYKSSVHTFDLNNAQNGVNIQMLLYLFALQSANEDNPTLSLRPGGVSYVPSKNNGASDEDASPYRLLAMNYHDSGLFIRDDVTEKDLEEYQKTVFSKLESDGKIDAVELEKLKKTFEPSVTNLAEAKFFNNLREDVMNKVKENLGAIFGGVIDALPLAHFENSVNSKGEGKSDLKDPCEYCRFGEICRNEGKNVVQVAKTKLRPKTAKADDPRTFWENKYIAKEEPPENPEKAPAKKPRKKSVKKEDGDNG